MTKTVYVRGTDPEDSDPEHLVARRKNSDHHAVSVADMVSIVLSIGGIVFVAGVVKTNVDHNTQDIEDIRTTQAKLWSNRDADKALLDERLRHIEEKLDTLIGEVDGGGANRHR